MKEPPKWAQIMAFIVFLFVLFLVMEFLLGFFVPQEKKLCIAEQDDKAFFRLQPNLDVEVEKPNHSIQTNSYGLRDREFGKKGESFRVLVVGDSLVFGYGVENNETWPKLIEKRFNEEYSHRDFEVINAGMPGTGTKYHFLAAKKFSEIYEPDLIIWMFTNGNDFADNMVSLEKGSVFVGGCLKDGQKNLMGIIKSTNTYKIIRGIVNLNPLLRKAAEDSGLAHFDFHMEVMFTETERGQLVEQYRQQTQTEIQNFSQYFEQEQIPLIFISFPSLEETDEDYLKKQVEKNYPEHNTMDFDTSASTNFLMEECQKNQMECLLMYDSLKGGFSTEQTLLPIDPHWNKGGTAIVTGQIFDYLNECHWSFLNSPNSTPSDFKSGPC